MLGLVLGLATPDPNPNPNQGGRLGLLTWKHSECAIVVDFFRSLEATRPELPLLRWYQAQPNAPPLPEGWALTMDEAVRPSDAELQRNSRSRSAILHASNPNPSPNPNPNP